MLCLCVLRSCLVMRLMLRLRLVVLLLLLRLLLLLLLLLVMAVVVVLLVVLCRPARRANLGVLFANGVVVVVVGKRTNVRRAGVHVVDVADDPLATASRGVAFVGLPVSVARN